MPSRTHAHPALLLLLLAVGCAGRFSAGGAEGGGEGSPGLGGATPPPGFGLTAVAPGPSALAIRWRRPDPAAEGFAIFLAESEANLYAGQPRLEDPPGEAALLAVAPDTTWFLGLALLEQGEWVPAGPTLTARTRAVVHADPSAPAGGDGSAGAPTRDLEDALAIAASLGGANVWCAAGTFAGTAETVPPGVDVYGGFSADFTLETRDPVATPTVLQGVAGADVLRVTSGGSGPTVLDGLTLAGAGGKNGVDLDGARAELRSLTIVGLDRGVRARAAGGEVLPLDLARCVVVGAALEGVSVEGPFALHLDGCAVLGCGQEGVDLNDLIAPPGAAAALLARDCRFEGNGSEGLDADLSAGAPTGGGRFEIDLRGCVFAENALAGARVDIEYETAAGWSTGLYVGGCSARANGTHGFSLDLDSRADVLLHRVASEANGVHGLLVSSESHPGVVQVTSSLFQGNAGYGVRSDGGNFAVLAGHVVLSGNRGGGIGSSFREASAVASVSYLQAAPSPNTFLHHPVDVEPGEPSPFVRAPLELHEVTGVEGKTVALAGLPGFGAGAPCELDGDEVPRTATAVAGAAVTLDVLPAGGGVPRTLAAFEPGGGVVEDHSPTPASVLLGAGLPEPGGAPTDAGPFGAPRGGAPGAGTVPRPGLWIDRVSPALGSPVGAQSSVLVELRGGDLATGSLLRGVSVVDAAEEPVGATFSSFEGILIVGPPPAGWQGGEVIRLHRGLRTTDGVGLAAEVAWRVVVGG